MSEILDHRKAYALEVALQWHERGLRKVIREINKLAVTTTGVTGAHSAALNAKGKAVYDAMADYHKCAEIACAQAGVAPLSGGTDKPDEI